PQCGYRLRREEKPHAPEPPARPAPRVAYKPPTEPRAPHTWMDTSEPRPVVPLAPRPAQAPLQPPPAATPHQSQPPQFAPANFFACPDCGASVAHGAFACPRCGRRFAADAGRAFQPPKSFNEKWLGMLLIALLAAVLIAYFC
ncbi:MAG TPA: hypothetical protein VGV38_21350, partial [Pyrinomonadaceae bacterium]|nr:hypothetical protein [Pyrinomonadaceae bacterium]